MRITSKGQVTIPIDLREKAGLMPHTEVEFSYENGKVELFPASKKGKRRTRGENLVEHLRRHGERHPITMTTDEIMKLMRGD